MNIKLIAGVVTKVLPFIPKLKGAIFSDGKFAPKRAAVLLVFTVVISGMVYLFGVDDTESIIDLLDDVSDIIGYDD